MTASKPMTTPQRLVLSRSDALVDGVNDGSHAHARGMGGSQVFCDAEGNRPFSFDLLLIREFHHAKS
jgi:hypothetical protein